MLCAISGKPAKIPVLSPSSKCIFEKSLIENYINETGKDPITNASITVDSLIPVSLHEQQLSYTNSLNSSTLNSNYSVPNLLSTLQNEFDAIMLENFKLRKTLDIMSKKLSTALYERDAAKLVAANLLNEKKTTLEDITMIVSNINDENSSMEKFNDTLMSESKSFVKLTKKNKYGSNLQCDWKLSTKYLYSLSDHPSLKTVTSLQGNTIKSAVYDDSKKAFIVMDGSVETNSEAPYDSQNPFKYITITNSRKILFQDSENKVFTYDIDSQQVLQSIELQSGAIFINEHEYIMKDYFLIVETTGKAIFKPYSGGKTINILPGSSFDKYHSASLHKDGILLALVNDTNVDIYNLLKPNELPTTFRLNNEIKEGNMIKMVQFASNGYWMIVRTDSHVFSFDLRSDPGTLAIEPLPVDADVLIDLHHSGRFLVTVKKEDMKLLIQSFQYTKYTNGKKWELENDTTVKLTKKANSEIDSIHLLYDDKNHCEIILKYETFVKYIK
ncbi:hypothetical protein KAFR_0L00250 [Kazachstania africana CBS 2517]|uniref:Pre-mRNA-processing factor 19 n=1 Tax=Kazachstania africana (strain ATCC 22294 / BCRC 22015 / CBS 2517 / CECT 1963 / NBRC 1671 / NRRL Y-8276) TaxID=1071382 RepID=H2B1Y2_KAZAF|nr:hypothetical protein KAFR_0L00250 [Kazachstania africana CBS 2517]CCF60632.1 hypothetical protein KAFR_0L00250 [Kazachstania africana CBS 2517]